MKKNTVIIGMILCATVISSKARIGETQEECVKRYGENVDSSHKGDKLFWFSGSVRVCCEFSKNKCIIVTYDLNVPIRKFISSEEKEIRFTKEQSFRLLNLNRMDSSWLQTSKDSFQEIWDGTYTTKDGKLHAKIDFTSITIETIENFNFETARVQAEVINKSLESMGAGSSMNEPKPSTTTFPPTPDEQRIIDMNKQLEKLKKSVEEDKK